MKIKNDIISKHRVQVGDIQVAYIGDHIYQFKDNKEKGCTGLSSLTWCKKCIETTSKELECLVKEIEQSGKSWHPEGYRVDQLKRDLFYWQDIMLPRLLMVYEARAVDNEVIYTTDHEYGTGTGKDFARVVKGPDLALASMNLKPGDRVIHNKTGVKYIYVNEAGIKYSICGNRKQYLMLLEEIMERVILTDFEAYQKLSRSHNFFN